MTHDFNRTSYGDWMDVASEISAHNDFPVHTAYEIDSAPGPDLVHTTAHNNHIGCIDERDYQTNELPFEHASEL